MDREQIRLVIERALEEDAGFGDVTSMWALPPNSIARARIIARADGVVAGLEVAEETFSRENALIAFTSLTSDGEWVTAETELATVVGPATSVLTAERTALNFLERMSGIATETRRYANAIKGTDAVVLGTRKTAPGLRLIDHWAVQLGGGGVHRARLDDMVLIRSSHIAIAGGLGMAMERVRAQNTGLQVVVEVRNAEQLGEALTLMPDRIMLTGMSIRDIANVVQRSAGRVPLEVAGELTLQEVRAIAETGVEYISVSALTQQAVALPMRLEIDAP